MKLMQMVRDVDNLKREVEKLRPSFSVGVLTNHTTRGTTRSVITFGQNQPTQSTSNNVARWA